MKRGLIIIAAAIQFILSGCGNVLTVKVENPVDFDRHPEMVELSLDDVVSRLSLENDEKFVIASKGKDVPYQITWDKKVVFPVEMQAAQSQIFKIRKGIPAEVPVQVCGDHYPHRVDDICWENDIVGYRVYGFKEDKASGYDIFTKKNTDLPVIPEFYRKAFDPEMRKIYNEMKKVNKDSADIFNNENMSFHVDHGYGADFYAVGPTLGAGTSALLDGDKIVYPFCWDSYEILDDGPIRFTIRLTFRPFNIGEHENVVETRTISLDLGSHFNRTEVSFAGLDTTMPIVSGIVVQDMDGKSAGDASKGYITYPAPTMNFCKHKEVDNGTVYLGHVYPESLEKTALTYFSEEESKARGGAKGHMLAHSQYDPAKPFTYYWGFAWNFANMETYQEWISHIETFSAQLRTPLTVNFK
jgi:hypothetical protein